MIKVTFKTFLCIAAFAALSPLSHASPTGGVIHFRGAIVEGGCDIASQERAVKITCNQQGKAVTRTVPYSKLADYTVHSDSTMQTNIRYLDPQRRLALVSVTYQ
ncbi:hypothetical protein MUA02_20750 [Enterobacteriaceae bacterium H20N1]|uniref:Type 1 fimbrial protein n=1 Tax=Dryocola boscaweniae TaxID=2925397 RepID=A0A9X3AD22_9ENTR|nr:hypothetical protein [Dryocola boscaweniae]MCT4704284.1 hypothetical protein [Dryocola boscaweniae]MCT4721452.1 hypothetical protein [Dryocola boscaweniae]